MTGEVFPRRERRRRPIGSRQAVLLGLAAALLLPSRAHAQSADTLDALRREALRAQSRYEVLARRLAPFTLGPTPTGRCDEYVGRFCLTFSPREERRPLPEEPERVTRARRELIERFRLVVAADPSDPVMAGQLVRYLIEDGRPREAVALARAHAWASPDSAGTDLLLGLALHAAGDHDGALRRFDRALATLPEDRRARLESVAPLLQRGERRVYERLDPRERERYHDVLWRLADPLYLTPANERRAEHLARGVLAGLLARTPPSQDVLSWGDDIEELTIRYGAPVARERIPSFGSLDPQILERYSPDQLAFVPPALRTEGVEPTPDPGAPWAAEAPAARDGYAPPIRLRHLSHQVSLFPAGDSVTVRVDGLLRLDTIGQGSDRITAGLFLLDADSARPVRALVNDIPVGGAGDGAAFAFEITVPPGEYVYSVEALDSDSGTGAMARHSVNVPAVNESGPWISDVLVTFPYGDAPHPRDREDETLRARANLVVAPDDTLGIYAEVHGLTGADGGVSRYAVELSVEGDRGGARVIRWLGRLLGLEGEAAPRIAWTAESLAGAAGRITVDVALGGLDEGNYNIVLTVRDLVTGRDARTLRRVRVDEATR